MKTEKLVLILLGITMFFTLNLIIVSDTSGADLKRALPLPGRGDRQTGPVKSIKRSCNEYAATAVAQNKENINKTCGFKGPGWNSNYQGHFNWCMHGENLKHADRENSKRQAELDKCDKCTPYAKNAIAQRNEAEKLGCEFINSLNSTLPGLWAQYINYHYNDCMQDGLKKAESYTEERAEEIEECKEKKRAKTRRQLKTKEQSKRADSLPVQRQKPADRKLKKLRDRRPERAGPERLSKAPELVPFAGKAGSISGKISAGNEGHLLVGNQVIVIAKNSSGKEVQTFIVPLNSKGIGLYSFSLLPPGSYSISVEKGQAAPAKDPLKTLNVCFEGTNPGKRNIMLTKKKMVINNINFVVKFSVAFKMYKSCW